jgi:hypothetical protein
MTTTAAPTDTESDCRKPDGTHAPFKHIVKIVVVPASGPHDESHDLTVDELEASEAFLKATDAPAAWNVTTGPPQSSNAPSEKPKMFDVLEPTDIVVVGREPASVRTIDISDNPAEPKLTKKLFPHDDCNRDTVLRVWTESDRIEYQCEREFEIVKVERAGWKIYGAPDNPFERERRAMPYKATKEPTSTIDAAGNPEFVWKWTSGVLPATANNQQYKPTFKIGGEEIDPDVVCGHPPPTP